MSYLLRVILPDRPGSLGGVASAIGEAGGDIVGVDVVEHRADGRAVDDILVDLLPGKMPDALVSACQSIADVTVEFVGHYSPGAHLHRDLEAVEAMTGEPRHAAEILVELLPGVFRSGWALLATLVDGRVTVQKTAGGAPGAEVHSAPWLPMPHPVRIVADDAWAPESWQDVVAVGAPLDTPERAVVFGRDGGPRILDSEHARLTHLAALAAVIQNGTGIAHDLPEMEPDDDGAAEHPDRRSGRDGERERQHLSGTGQS
ncbi:ACT domain-containing protein [Phytoactinopolyspora halotolerans]|uniref:ACT domain-containing protein n=1 Tax=Phytoactinopolyspora halotolerans TaxID=1981512 RepID=UPI001C204C4A|nr:ACT domain-containing protein [Phytoactinopolyspora halotolerans]